MTARRWRDGVEIALLPLWSVGAQRARFYRRAFFVSLFSLAACGLGLLILTPLESVSYGLFPVFFVCMLWVSLVAQDYGFLQKAGVVQFLDGILTVVEEGKEGKTWPRDAVEFVQTFTNLGRTELQVLLRDRTKARVFHGRPRAELEWIAGEVRREILGEKGTVEVSDVRAAEGSCSVCGSRMDARVVYCARCRTPHHEECWTYTGQCSTFGCREIRFVKGA